MAVNNNPKSLSYIALELKALGLYNKPKAFNLLSKAKLKVVKDIETTKIANYTSIFKFGVD